MLGQGYANAYNEIYAEPLYFVLRPARLVTKNRYKNCEGPGSTQTMAITQKSIKLLWAAAGGRCAFTNCWVRLCFPEAKGHAPYTLGEMAHICGEKPGANRHDAAQTQVERDDYKNLILLCPNHHAEIDRKETEKLYTVVSLLEMKRAHEIRVHSKLEFDHTPEKRDVAREILALLVENHKSWAQYGPLSKLAKSQPHNDAAYAVWVSERLSVIVPNNRKITELLTKNKAAFLENEQDVVASFLIHARSYEKWVEDEIPYGAVARFPVGFDAFVRRIVDVST